MNRRVSSLASSTRRAQPRRNRGGHLTVPAELDAGAVVAFSEERVRPPGPGEIQVAGLCALITAGSEMNLYRGKADLPDLSAFATAGGRLPFPVKFGYHEVGEETAVGERPSLHVGDTVLCHHPVGLGNSMRGRSCTMCCV